MNFLEQFKGKKVVVASHNDLDGIGSTILAMYYIQPLAKEIKFINTDKYDLSDQSDLDSTIDYFEIFICTDFPIDINLYLKLKEKNKCVIIIDHHQSGYTTLKNIALENYYYDITRCGTKIFLDEIAKCTRIKKVIWQFVEYVNIYDLYQMNSSMWRDARGLSNILWAQCNWDKEVHGTAKYVNFISSILYKFNNYKIFAFTEYEQNQMLNAENKEQQNLKEAKRKLQIRTDNQGNTYGYFECTSKQSIVANYILSEMDKLRYVVAHVTWGETEAEITPKVSIRSVEDRGIDCSIIADIWGGGGHKLSSGIEFKNFEDFKNLREGKLHLI